MSAEEEARARLEVAQLYVEMGQAPKAARYYLNAAEIYRDANLPENDSGLDVDHWTGTTGCVVLAPHLRKCRKKDLGLPHVSEATDYQKSKKLCWECGSIRKHLSPSVTLK